MWISFCCYDCCSKILWAHPWILSVGMTWQWKKQKNGSAQNGIIFSFHRPAIYHLQAFVLPQKHRYSFPSGLAIFDLPFLKPGCYSIPFWASKQVTITPDRVIKFIAILCEQSQLLKNSNAYTRLSFLNIATQTILHQIALIFKCKWKPISLIECRRVNEIHCHFRYSMANIQSLLKTNLYDLLYTAWSVSTQACFDRYIMIGYLSAGSLMAQLLLSS